MLQNIGNLWKQLLTQEAEMVIFPSKFSKFLTDLVTRVKSTGTLKIKFEVSQKHMSEYGFDLDADPNK